MINPRKARPAVDELMRRYRESATRDGASTLGFSARLNLLWDLADLAPSQLEGRVLGLLAINPDWREAEVRRWLQQDLLPSRRDLRNMVSFLVSELGPEHDPLHWEAFLIYGPPIVPSPFEHILYQADAVRREVAAQILARLVERYRIPPSSYDAAGLFQHCLRCMQQFNIYEHQDFQAGHLELFHNLLFPRSNSVSEGKSVFPLPSDHVGENTVQPGKE